MANSLPNLTVEAKDGEWIEFSSNNAGTVRVRAGFDRLDFDDHR